MVKSRPLRRRDPAMISPATIHHPMAGLVRPAPTSQPPLLSVPEPGCTHFPVLSHNVGATQSLAELQVCLHVPSLAHLYGEQSCMVPLALVVVWSPSHVAPDTHLLVTRSQRLPATQSSSLAQLVLHAVAP